MKQTKIPALTPLTFLRVRGETKSIKCKLAQRTSKKELRRRMEAAKLKGAVWDNLIEKVQFG